jgi:FliI/YscN family ATPase
MLDSFRKPEDVLQKYRTVLKETDPILPLGRVVEVNGISILSFGPPDTSIGQLCRIEPDGGKPVLCEVTGFRNNQLILMPFGSTEGIYPSAVVHNTGRRMSIYTSMDLLGRILNGMGQPIDGKPPILQGELRSADASPPDPISRKPIDSVLVTGVKAIDGLLTVGLGQRIGIFAGTGVGKSTMLGMIARYTRADASVICLVGERGREVREFIERDLGPDGMKRCVLVVATSDRSAIEKVYAALFATTIAEYLRDQGMHVNLLMDSVTRYCMALREIGIASGEQLGPGGYPPAVWFKLSRLVERSGVSTKGTITGFYSVLVEADDLNDPVADATRGLLDGHIVLSRRLARKNHYPAIEIPDSISRVMDQIVSADHRSKADQLKAWISAYRENEEIVSLGAYARGSNPDLDQYLARQAQIQTFLKQSVGQGYTLEQTLEQLSQVTVTAEEEY